LKRRLTQTVRTIVFLALAFFLLWLSFKGTDFGELWAVLKKARYMWLLPAAVVSLLSFLIRAHRWNLLIEPMGYKPALMNAYHSVVTGYFANMLLPRLGEVAKCASLARKEKMPFDRIVGTMLVERTIDVLTVLFILGLTLIAGGTAAGRFLYENVFNTAGGKLSPSVTRATIIVIILFALAIVAVVIYFKLRKRLSRWPLLGRVYTFTDGIIDGLKSIVRLKKRWEFLLLTLLLWISYLFMSYFPLLCLGSTADLGLSAAMYILVVGSFGMAAPVQSGLGAYHWIVSRGLLVAYAIPLEEGLAYATLSHESQMLLIAIAGAISLYALFGRKGGNVLSSVVAKKEA
jgi:uncharacterized protein (TIRG00374 family)